MNLASIIVIGFVIVCFLIVLSYLSPIIVPKILKAIELWKQHKANSNKSKEVKKHGNTSRTEFGHRNSRT